MKRLATAVITLALLALSPIARADWATSSNTDSGAEVRAGFVHEIRVHQEEVRVAEIRRARAARVAAFLAAQAAAEAAAAAATPDPAPSSSSPTYSTSSEGGRLSDAQVASYLRGAGFPETAIDRMIYYAHRESGNCPTAVNGLLGCPSYGAAAAALADGSACGLWQIYTCPGPDALDPARNAALAYSKYQSSGFSPWGG